MGVRKVLSIASLTTIFILSGSNVLSYDSVCILKDLPSRIKEHIKNYSDHSRWRALDKVLTSADVINANRCFLRWAKKYTKHSQHEIIRTFRGFNQSTENPVYAPASNFGYAKVYFSEYGNLSNSGELTFEKNSFFLKESFYLDTTGSVYPNLLFIMNYGENKKWNFYSYNYINDKLEKKTECMKCHKRRRRNNFLFGSY